MDRLVKPDVKELYLNFIRGQKCATSFKLTNLMHTMSVAISLTTTNPQLFSFSHPLSILPPLSTSSFTLFLTRPSDDPPLSSTSPDSVVVRSSVLPTGKAPDDDLHRLFSKTGTHILKDASIRISLVGPQVVEYLISSFPKSLELVDFLLPRAIAYCDEPDLTSLLRSAVMCGNSRLVSALIEAGADLSGGDLMSLAIKSGKTDVVGVLIELGCRIDSSVDHFLHDAAKIGRLDLMEVLCLGYGDMDVNSINSDGQTALHVAAMGGNTELLRFLVLAGGDTEIADNDGWTPLHCASSEGHEEGAEFLLGCSSFVKYAVTKEGKTAFALAVDNGGSNLLLDMLRLGDLLHRAARVDDVHGLKNSLAGGARVNSVDQNGWTALHRAAFKGRVVSVELLLQHGARVDNVDDAGYTPLRLAVEGGHLEVAMCLIAHGAVANVKGLKHCNMHHEKQEISFV